MTKTKYTVGFVFDEKKMHVGLLRKKRPVWQFNRLNGVGGHMEGEETPMECMIREFGEEIHNFGRPVDWKEYACLEGKDFVVYCFAGIGDPTKMQSKIDEPWEVHSLIEINATTTRTCIENLPWLLAMAVDHLEDGRPVYAHVKYD